MNTHIGRKRNTVYANRGRLYGHSMPRAGKWHALVGRWPDFRTLCGESVRAENSDGDPAESLASAVNVYEAGKQTVTCQRCLRKLVAEAQNAAH